MVKDRTLRLTPAGKTKLEDELSHLITEKRPALATRIQESTEHGDVSDNSEYEAVKEEFVLVDARIRELEQILERAEIVEHPEADDEVSIWLDRNDPRRRRARGNLDAGRSGGSRYSRGYDLDRVTGRSGTRGTQSRRFHLSQNTWRNDRLHCRPNRLATRLRVHSIP